MSSIELQQYQPVMPFDSGEKQEKTMEPVKKSRQFIAAIIANLSSFAVGTCLGWTSPVNPKLEDAEQSPLGEKMDSESEEAAWIGSIIALGALIAPFGAGYLADLIGRKWTLLSSTLFFLTAYLMLMVGHTAGIIIAARLIQGFGTGFVMTATPMYIGEIATDDCRGALGSFMQLFIVAGILYVYVVGPYVSYVVFNAACFVVPIIFAGTFFFMPDSPFYFIAKGRKTDAINALKFLRGQSEHGVQDEMASIQSSVEEALREKGSFLDLFKNKGNVRALIICCGLISFQQLSGINVVLFNSQTIFAQANTSLNPAIATIIVGIVQVVASGVTPLIVDRLGRKPILLVSAGGMCIGLGILALFFYLLSIGTDVSSFSFLPIISLILFVAVYCVGFGPLPWAVLGEMFPANVKSVASSIVATDCWILGFIVTRWYPALNALGTYYAFGLFAILCVVAFVFVFTIVMETKGLTLNQIQDKLNGR